jgi:hypothetical protein
VGGGIDFDHVEKRCYSASSRPMVRHWRSASGAQGARQPGRDLEGPTVTVDVAQAWAADEQRRHEDDTVGEVLPANQINQIAEPGSSFGNWVKQHGGRRGLGRE